MLAESADLDDRQRRQLRIRQAFGEHDALQSRQGARHSPLLAPGPTPPKRHHGRSSGPAVVSARRRQRRRPISQANSSATNADTAPLSLHAPHSSAWQTIT